jgi:hypothetical protein
VIAILLVLAGLALLVFGGGLLVDGAIRLARGMGVAESIIGLTIVAIGTSMPELVTSVMAALRKQTDVAFGNIVGSNIANVLVILGISALILPIAVGEGALRRDGMIGLAVACALGGVAVFGMLDRAGLARCFPELADLSCALDDCAHAGEPGCGLPTAGLHPVRRAAFDRLAAALEGVVEGDVADGLGGVRRDDAD